MGVNRIGMNKSTKEVVDALRLAAHSVRMDAQKSNPGRFSGEEGSTK